MASGKEHYDRKVFFDTIRPAFGKLQQAHVDGMNMILDAWEPTPFKDRRCLADILGQVRGETGDMMPKEEYGGASRSYGQPHPTTGKRYYGRGQIQLTHYDNYARATREINDRNLIGRKVDLVNKPEQALEPDISPLIAIHGMEEGWFTGKKLSDYFNETTTDWVNARRVVNGTDRAHEIAGYAQSFYAALTAAATTEEPEQPDKPDDDDAELDPVLASLKEQIKARTGAKNVLLEL